MTITEKFFVECVSNGIKNQKIQSIPDGIDYKQLYELCKTQSMSVVVYNALQKVKDKLSNQFTSALEVLMQLHVMQDIQSQYDIKTVLDAFEHNGIKHMPLKGYHLKKLYPSTDMRYASDCDLLIDVNQIEKVRQIVSDLGLKTKRHDEHHDIVYYPESKTVFELHKTIFVGELEKYFGVGFKKAHVKEGYKYFYQMDKEIFYISILAHSAYHFAESAGVGIRHLTDIYLYRKAHKLNEEYLNAELEKCGLLQFKNEFEKLADYFFEGADADEFTLKLAGHVLESSILANQAKQTASDVASKSKGDNSKNAKRRTIWMVLFPKKESMQFSYPVLKKHGWLLPFYYIVRWFHVLFTRPKNIAKLKKISAVDNQELNHMKEIRNGLGINGL